MGNSLDIGNDYRSHYTSTYGSMGSYEYYAPAYEYGARMGQNSATGADPSRTSRRRFGRITCAITRTAHGIR